MSSPHSPAPRPLAVLLSCVGLLAAPCLTLRAEAPPERVFVCAHSFMTFISDLLPPMAASAGLDFQLVGRQMIGGSRVLDHWKMPDDKAKPALESGSVDTLILSPTVPLPDPGIDNFVRLGASHNPKLRVLIQASWPAFDAIGVRNMDEFHAHAAHFTNAERNQATLETLERMRATQRQGWSRQLGEQVASLNRELGREVVRIVPVNDAVFTLRERMLEGGVPGLKRQTDLFLDPIGHPTAPLTVLVAYCHYSAVFGRSPVGLPAPPVLGRIKESEQLNRTLQEMAWATVGKTML